MNFPLAVCQLRPVPGSPSENAETVIKVMESDEADVMVFPEMFLTGYGSPLDGLEDEVGRSLGLLSDKCRELDKAVCIGTPRFGSDGLFNSLAFLSPDGDSYYDKAHLARFGIYSEDGFSDGQGPAMGSYHGVLFGMCICYDVFFPEILHGCSLRGASVNICAAASAVQSKRFLDTVLPARALENVTYLAYANNIGAMNDCGMHGCSRILNPFGDVMSGCGTEERVAIADIDLEALEDARDVRQHLENYRTDVDWGV